MSVEKMMHDMIEMLTDAMGDAVKHDKGNKVCWNQSPQGYAVSQDHGSGHPCPGSER